MPLTFIGASFRPHHFFCTLGFQGKGYSDAFVENFSALKSDLTDTTLIRVTEKTDDICAPCPHRLGDLCNKQSKIHQLDQAHAEALSLKSGDVLTWGNAKKRLATLSLEDHQHICKGCEWLELGLCAKALEKLKASPKNCST